MKWPHPGESNFRAHLARTAYVYRQPWRQSRIPMVSHEHKKRAKLKRSRDAEQAWADIFAEEEVTCALECHQGDRVTTAHIRRFESATEEMVQEVWGVNASTSAIVKNWDNFILGQLLAATKGPNLHAKDALNCRAQRELCETCLRSTANQFAKNLHVTRISSDSAGSTPNPSRCSTPRPSHADEHTRPDEARSQTSHSRCSSPKRLSRPLRIWALNTVDLRIYVTSSYIHLLRSSPASICTDTPSTYTSLYLDFLPSEQSLFPPCSNPIQHLSVYTLLLATDSQNLLSTENAGGSSIESEVLSFEVLKRIMPYWELSTMEMSTTYASSGPITDFVARSHISPEQEISVSVTRIFGWSSNMKISKSALTPLLIRKLAGLRSATSRILPERRRGMILFIWVPDGTVEKNVHRVWNKLRADARLTASNASSRQRTAYGVSYESGITDNVIVFVGVCKKESWMDLRGWQKVFGKRDSLEDQYLFALTGDDKYIVSQSSDTTSQATLSHGSRLRRRKTKRTGGHSQNRQMSIPLDSSSQRAQTKHDAPRRNTFDSSELDLVATELGRTTISTDAAIHDVTKRSSTSGSANRRRWRQLQMTTQENEL